LTEEALWENSSLNPIDRLERVRDTILEKIKNGTPNILLIGGGPAGVEIQGNV
jgi:NADH dehydrogenase FAD-containing subunit